MNDHSFNVQVAIDFDVETAVVLNNLAFWLNKNAANKTNFHEGKYWSYNSYDAWTDILPYWSAKQMRRILDNAIKNGLIIKGTFNGKKYDNTNWYTLTSKALEYYPKLLEQLSNTPAQTGKTPAQTGKTPAQTGRPIPDSNPDSNPDSKKDIKDLALSNEKSEKALSKKQEEEAIARERFEIFYYAYPRRKGKKDALKWFIKNKPSQETLELMIKDIPILIREAKGELSYIPYASTYLNQERFNDNRGIPAEMQKAIEGFNDIMNKESKNETSSQKHLNYQEYVGRIKSDIELKILPKNTEIKTFEEFCNE